MRYSHSDLNKFLFIFFNFNFALLSFLKNLTEGKLSSSLDHLPSNICCKNMAVLAGMVAQSAGLDTKASWGPLKSLAVASATNGFGEPAMHLNQ